MWLRIGTDIMAVLSIVTAICAVRKSNRARMSARLSYLEASDERRKAQLAEMAAREAERRIAQIDQEIRTHIQAVTEQVQWGAYTDTGNVEGCDK